MIGAIALLLSLALLWVRRFDAAVQLGALQAWCVAVAIGETAMPIAVVAVLLNGIALPLTLARLPAPPDLARRGSVRLGWSAALLILLATLTIVAKYVPGLRIALGVSVVLLALLLIALRPHPLVPVLGLLSAQNGVLLVAGALPELPLSVALVSAMPLVPALVLADTWVRR